MTDAQIVAIAITVLAVLGGTLINNSRLTDVKETLRAEMKVLEARIENRLDRIDHKLDEILRIVGDHDSPIAALERGR